MPCRKTKKREEDLSAIDLANEEMGYVLSLIERTDQSLFLTGKAGTGKSTLLRHICATTHKKFVVLAPTGLAALNVGGHSGQLCSSTRRFGLERYRRNGRMRVLRIYPSGGFGSAVDRKSVV